MLLNVGFWKKMLSRSITGSIRCSFSFHFSILCIFILILIFGTVKSDLSHQNELKSAEICKSKHQPVVNKLLKRKKILTISPIGPKQCSQKCSLTVGCLSFNFKRQDFSCDLNFADETTDVLDTDEKYEYYRRQDTPEIGLGGCANITCGPYYQCVDLLNHGPYCSLAYCGDPPTKSRATLKDGSYLVGTTRDYTCLEGHRTEGSTTITCQTNGQWTSTTLFCIPTTWPLGTYGLFKAASGCPEEGNWAEGNRVQYSAFDPTTDWHADIPTFMGGMFSKAVLRYDFCIRDSEVVTSFDLPWQPGSYCLLKKFTCPAGFAAGSIYMDDGDTNNGNSFSGILPDGEFDSNTRFDYCCRSDGSAFNSIYLPTHTSFYLLRKGGICQHVATMLVQEQWIYFDGEDSNPHAPYFQGEIPDSVTGGTNNWNISFCRYYK